MSRPTEELPDMRHPQGPTVEPDGSTPTDARAAWGRLKDSRAARVLVGVVLLGVVVIAAIGFAGSYAAVRNLALNKGFGWFANVFPIGVDAGIVVLLALDLLLTWLRIPFPLLRQTAWLLTAATIAFNAASAWPDKIGVGMHAIIPVLFVVSVEAARHAIGRVADITADKHMEGVRFTRWILAPLPTFRLWRRMKLWELRSYEEVIRREQDRLVYRARLRARYGAAWRRKAPIEAIMPLRLARYGVPLSETAPAGLRAAGIDAPELEWGATVPALPAAEPTEAVSTELLDATEPVPADIGGAESVEPGPSEVSFEDYRAYAQETGTFPTAGHLHPYAQEQDDEQLLGTQPEQGRVDVPVALPAEEMYPMAADLAGAVEQPVDVADPEQFGGAAAQQPEMAGWGDASTAVPSATPEPEQLDRPLTEPATPAVAVQLVGALPERRQPRSRVQAKVSAEEAAPQGGSARAGNTRQRVADLLDALPPEQRDLSQRELGELLAAQLGIGAEGVRKHLRVIAKERQQLLARGEGAADGADSDAR